MLPLLCEIATIMASQYPSPLSRITLSLLMKDPASVSRLTLAPTWVIGSGLFIVGAYIRKVCYATLGRLFTYQLTVLKDHKLVTSGPYSVVRHPGYSGMIMTLVGMVMMEYLPGSYLAESGSLDGPWAKACLMVWIVCFMGVPAGGFVRRVSMEDEVLRKEFGSEWEEWAKKTPYKLLPLVY